MVVMLNAIKKKINIKTIFLCIMTVVIAWVVYLYLHKPDKTIIVRFKESPPISLGFLRNKIGAYYRGVKVGEVSKVILSENQQYVLFYLNINYKNLILPENIRITLRIQNIFSDSYMEISYPESPSPKLLCDNKTIEGTAMVERIDNYLITQLESGQLKEVLTNLNTFLLDLKSISDDPKSKKDIQNILNKLSRVLDQVSLIVEDKKLKNRLLLSLANIQSLSTSLPEINKNIHRTNLNVSKVDMSVKEVENTFLGVEKHVAAIDQNIPIISEDINHVKSLISSTNKDLVILNSRIPTISQGFIEKTESMLDRSNCFTEGVGNMLDKRFLIFRFMFGKPGSFFKECLREEKPSPARP